MKSWIALCVLLGALVAGPAYASEPPANPPRFKLPSPPRGDKAANRDRKERQRTEALLRFLDTQVKEVNFDDTPLEDVFDWLKAKGLKNLVVSWKVMARTGDITRETPITLSLQDVTIREVLDLALSLASGDALTEQDELTYHIFRGMLKISTKADFDRQVYTRTYYVEDLLYPISLNEMLPFIQLGSQFAYVAELDPQVGSGAAAQRPIVDVINTGSLHGPGDPEYGQPDFQGARESELEKLVELLKSVRPASWTDGGGRGTITAFGDKLVIQQNIEMHEIIGGTFREMRALQKKRSGSK